MFEEVQLGFLVVRDNHEGIIGNFVYPFQKLKEKDNYVLIDLMKKIMISEGHSFVLLFIFIFFKFQNFGQKVIKRWARNLG
jgi:hypothetical protein